MKTPYFFYSCLSLLFFYFPSQAQQVGAWQALADVKIEKKMDKSGKYEIEFPVFGNTVKALANKEIVLKGYIIPLEELQGQNYFVFSALPYSMCFFCGNAGPETVIEVKTKATIPFTDKQISIKGKLQINEGDPDHLMYILNEAVQVK